MRATLLYRDRNFELDVALPPNEPALRQDLEVDTLLKAMAGDDAFLFGVARKVLLSSETELETILYRQDVLRDCRAHGSVIRDIYALSVEAIEGEGKHFWRWADHSRVIMPRAVDVLQMLVGILQGLQAIANRDGDKFTSTGFRELFGVLKSELSDEYFAEVIARLRELNFRDGVLVSAELGKGNKGVNYILRSETKKGRWMERVFAQKAPVYTLDIDPRDEHGARAVSELAETGINLVANALAQSADHILGFFRMLRTELAFYVGCLNLEERLSRKGEPLCFPVPTAPHERTLSFSGLYDVCLSLGVDHRLVGNDVNADGKQLIVISGANQGGKSTFLRGVGLAQLMMQSGMFVAAESFRANICQGVFTHFNREEDTAMKSGKLDEELSRMSVIVDWISPGSMILFNESFASTNEREGSEIADQIVSAFLERDIKVLFVTHMFEFTQRLYEKKMAEALYLRAEREDGGRRTFRLSESAPVQTSFGEDLYDRIFLAEPSD